MELFIKRLWLVPLALFLFASDLQAQTSFLYVNNLGSPHTVSGFTVSVSGALTPIAGSPFATGGFAGGLSTSNDKMAISPNGDFLYVPNGDSANITVFSISPSTGSLTPVPGSPFATGLSIDQITLAATPDNRFLYASNSLSGRIAAFAVNVNGSLTPVDGSPFFAGGIGTGRISVSRAGKLVSISIPDNNRVAVFNVAVSGALTQVPGSPFDVGDEEIGEPFAPEFNCANTRLFCGEHTFGYARIEVLSVDSNGSLTSLPGSPFTFPDGINSRALVLSPDDRFLFAANFNGKISVLRIGDDGTPSAVAGSPFVVGNPGEDRLPVDVAVNRTGTLLYTANGDGTISVFAIKAGGALSPVAGSPFQNIHGFGASLAVFPPTTCSPPFDICLQDDSNGNLLRVNSTTGEYQFTNCRGLTVSGNGSLARRGCLTTFSADGPDRRISAKLDGCLKNGSASVQIFSQGTFTIIDRNIGNNTCGCSGPP
jgi:6-phosphogluconolactonase (cycloisomerase 2 family)